MKITLKPFLLFGTLFLGTALLLGSCKKHTGEPAPTPTPGTNTGTGAATGTGTGTGAATGTGTGTTTPPPILKITSFGPDSGAMGSTVIIHGTKFGNSIAKISVKFNGISATATAITDSTLTVTVPVIHIGDGKISVQVGAENVTSATDFKYLYKVTTLAGDSTGHSGYANGAGTIARFNNPCGLTIDGTGNIYVADFFNNRIRQITPAGVVSTIAGDGTAGLKNDPVATAAQFNQPYGLGIDAAGNIYVADVGNAKIRKISPAGVTSLPAVAGAAFSQVTTDAAGNIYASKSLDQLIVKIDPTLTINVFAGSGLPGFKNATGAAAQFNIPSGLAADAAGNIYVADYTNNMIRKITPAGVVTTVAGSTTGGYHDGAVSTALFSNPVAVALDAAGNIYVTDNNNRRIRKITPAGIVSTIAGSGAPGFHNGIGNRAQFTNPFGIIVDTAGNIYVSDGDNNNIRKIQ